MNSRPRSEPTIRSDQRRVADVIEEYEGYQTGIEETRARLADLRDAAAEAQQDTGIALEITTWAQAIPALEQGP